ncbi:MAG: hypothetical protein Q7Q71_13435 [Verrucomicrobiota bacterium JB023]|nr:hypothetical protein [Verrucomicrobiota bacterium JB023]
MPARFPLLAFALSSPALAWDWNNNADVSFWAPGMGSTPIYMSQVQGGGPGPQYVGNYYAYVIKGISGTLTLGNRNLYDEYWEPSKSWQRSWNGKNSWATVGFQINSTYFTNPDLFFTVSGDHAGYSTGSVAKFLDEPIVIKSRGSWDTSITFVPHVNSWFIPAGNGVSNKTPSCQFMVIADLYRTAPELKGNLTVSKNWVFPSRSVTLSWDYDRGSDAIEGYTVPEGFDGLLEVSGGSL